MGAFKTLQEEVTEVLDKRSYDLIQAVALNLIYETFLKKRKVSDKIIEELKNKAKEIVDKL